MTLAASLSSKIKNSMQCTYWVIFLASEASAASMTSAASTASVASMTSTASFHQKNYTAWCFHQTWHQNDISWSLNVGWIINFIDFWHPFCRRLWRTGMLLLTKLKGHKSNVHYSGFPKHLQTKSSLHISICQSKLKHKYLTLDTLYMYIVSSRRAHRRPFEKC